MFRLEFELCSFADLRRPGALARLGRALDSEPTLRLERMDVREPLRNVVASAEAYLSDGGDLLSGAEVLFKRRRFPRLTGELHARAYGRVDGEDVERFGDAERPHRLRGEMAETDRDWLLDDSNLEAFVAWFGRLAAAFDASYGYAADHQMAHQQAGEFGRLRRERRWAPLPPGPESDRHSVRDVYWLNYFGPAYVAAWGERLAGLGVATLPTANGGVIVRATPTPFVHREDVASFMDYEWKRPFYDALGREAFVNAVVPAWVARVPTREDHLRALGAGADSR